VDRWFSPQAVQTFLDEFSTSKSEPVDLANNLTKKDYQDYIRGLFDRMRSKHPDRRHFLVSLKVCKVLSLGDTLGAIGGLQEKIFGDKLGRPFYALGSFIYQREGRIGLHDLYYESIVFDEDEKVKVYGYVKRILGQVVPPNPLLRPLETRRFWGFLADGADYGISFDFDEAIEMLKFGDWDLDGESDFLSISCQMSGGISSSIWPRRTRILL
jgi:hypothetical protein